MADDLYEQSPYNIEGKKDRKTVQPKTDRTKVQPLVSEEKLAAERKYRSSKKTDGRKEAL